VGATGQSEYHWPMDLSFDQMSPAERILYVQDLWDRIAEHPEDVPVTDEMKAELDRRLAEHRADPSTAVPWETVKARLRTKR
jgi:putative addiction module component (TIGR02574 family)